MVLHIGGRNAGDSVAGCANERTLPVGSWNFEWYDAAPDLLREFYGQRQEGESEQHLQPQGAINEIAAPHGELRFMDRPLRDNPADS